MLRKSCCLIALGFALSSCSTEDDGKRGSGGGGGDPLPSTTTMITTAGMMTKERCINGQHALMSIDCNHMQVNGTKDQRLAVSPYSPRPARPSMARWAAIEHGMKRNLPCHNCSASTCMCGPHQMPHQHDCRQYLLLLLGKACMKALFLNAALSRLIQRDGCSD